VGEVRPVLWEHHQDGALWPGLTDNYLRVYTQSEADLFNTITPVRLTGLAGIGDADGMSGQIEGVS
jgi:hypothetical protein